MKFTKKRLVLCTAVAAALLLAAALDHRMTVRRYDLDAARITQPIRIALVTDLHSCYYGKEQTDLISAIDAQSPDLILLGGDIFDDEVDDANTERFLAGIGGRYPCYYVTGNHEYWSGAEAFAGKMAILEKYGVTILSGDCKTIQVNGESINLCGVNDPDSYMIRANPAQDAQTTFDEQLDRVEALAQNDAFTVLLCHRPEFFESYCSRSFDLVLCGHAHGGQWRIPWLLNGLYAPNQGLFPQYAGGQYERSGTTMIVSRGLARESTRIPRIFNRPELVIVTVR